MAPHGDDHYHPQDALSGGVKAGLITGGAGLLFAAVKNQQAKKQYGAWGVFTRGGTIIGTFAAAGTAFEFTRAASANLREKNDHYNHAIAGFVSGSVVGLHTGRMPRVLGIGALFSVIFAAYDFLGGSLRGNDRTLQEERDEFDRKEFLRKNRRRPVEETLAEVGEGRSIRPPGYEERRRLRLKEKYGLDINPVSADPNAV